MSKTIKRGWHFLQIPGPSNTPTEILRAMSQPTLDHRGPEFGQLTRSILERIRTIFVTKGHVIIYPSSGTGAWEAALMNLFSPGDKILAIETGHFAILWKKLADKIGLDTQWIEGDWRHGADPRQVLEILKKDKDRSIKGLMVVHNETSNGITSDIKQVRQAMDEVNHSALLLVDVVSSLGTSPFKQDEWGVDVAICASQKGFMMPPGLGFNSINDKARQYALGGHYSHSYWEWERIIDINEGGYYPYTPASGLLLGLDKALDMMLEEGMDNIWSRHERLARACRAAAHHWGLENQCADENLYSSSTTALRLPNPFDSDELRRVILEKYNMSLGTGLGKLKSRVFRIGHLGDFNELMLMATLSGVEMGLRQLNIPHRKGGIMAAMDSLMQ